MTQHTIPQRKLSFASSHHEKSAGSIGDKMFPSSYIKAPNIQRKCASCEEEEVQMKPRNANKTLLIQKQEEEEEEMLQTKLNGNTESPTSSLESSLSLSKSAGQQLDNSTHSLMSRNIGVNFANVRVHTDSNAIQMNQRLNAKSFTNGSDIYFNKGQYMPQSITGKHLLAHELAHVTQQRSGSNVIQRKPLNLDTSTAGLHESVGQEYSRDTGTPYEPGIQYSSGYDEWLKANTPSHEWSAPNEIHANPLERLKQNKSTAKTFLVINGKEIDGNNMAALMSKLQAEITPKAIKSKSIDGGKVECKFDPTFVLKGGTKIVIPTTPGKNGWKAKLPPSALGNPPVCSGKSDIPTVLHGKPDHQTYYKLVKDSELEHVSAIKVLFDRHIVPFFNFAMHLTAQASSEADCKIQLIQQLGKRAEQAAFGFVLGDAAETKRFDEPGGTHHGKMSIVDFGTNCNKVTMESSQNNPQQPGRAPGNIRTIRPTSQAIDPSKLTTNGNDLVSDGTVIKTFSSADNAVKAMGLLMVNQITEIKKIGPFEFAFSNGSVPILKVHGIPELKIDPSLAQVSIGIPSTNNWVISEVKGDQYFEITNFGSKRDQAYSAIDILRQNGFTHKIWIGSAQSPELSYFLKI